jgi:acyl-CoA hydrolase
MPEPERTDQRSPSDSSVQIAHLMGIGDANSAGNVHGGTVMKLCDEAAGLAAIKHSRRRVVTAAMDRMNFLFPIHVGELVTFRARVNAAWQTSMEVGVRVDAENPRTGEIRHTNTAYLTMVALDEEGRPTKVPPIDAVSPVEQRRMREAELRRANRLAERDQIVEHRHREGQTDREGPRDRDGQRHRDGQTDREGPSGRERKTV